MIQRVCGANRVKALPDIVTVRKDRAIWALSIKREGTTEYKSRAGTCLSDSRHAVFLPQGSDYEWRCTPGECLIVEFEANVGYGFPFSVPIHDSDELIAKFNRIEKVLCSDLPDRQWSAISVLYEMLLYLSAQSRNGYALTNKEKMIGPVIDFIRAEYADPLLSNEILAGVAGISVVYLRKLFYGIYGCGPMEYVYRFRMEKAASLLSGDYNSVSAIAESIGYSSIYHFSRMFKKYYGVAPTRFRPSPGAVFPSLPDFPDHNKEDTTERT